MVYWTLHPCSLFSKSSNNLSIKIKNSYGTITVRWDYKILTVLDTVIGIDQFTPTSCSIKFTFARISTSGDLKLCLLHSGQVILPWTPLVGWIPFRQWRRKLCKQGNCLRSVNVHMHTEQDTSAKSLYGQQRFYGTLLSFIFAGLKFRENFLGTFRESLISRSRRKIVFAGNLISRNWRLSDFIFSFLQKLYVNQQLKQNQYAVP